MFSRVGVYERLPGVDVDRFAESMQSGGGLMGYIDALSGGSISKVGVFSLGAPSLLDAHRCEMGGGTSVFMASEGGLRTERTGGVV